MEKQEKSLIFNQLVKYASIIALLVIANSYILYLNGINEYTNQDPKFIYNLKIIFIGIGIYFGLNNLSYRILKVKFTFWQFLLYGIIMGALYGVLSSVYFVIYVQKLAPDTIDAFLKVYDNIQMPYFNIEDLKEMASQMFQSPIVLFFTNFIGEIIQFAFYTLLFAIFYIIFPKPKNLK